jgi:hypothetical protein
VTALIAWPSLHLQDGTEVDNQVAAPAETRTPNWHRAKIAHRECGWKGGDSGDSARRESCLTKMKNHLTPTGLLMEGDYTHNPLVGVIDSMTVSAPRPE